MDRLKYQKGRRDWDRQQELRKKLDEAYKDNEVYWRQKSRIQWLHEGDKNTEFFYASTVQRRKFNRLDQLEKEDGGYYNSEEEMVGEISECFSTLFTSANSFDWIDSLNDIPSTVTESMNSNLIKSVEHEEIEQSIFSMNGITLSNFLAYYVA